MCLSIYHGLYALTYSMPFDAGMCAVLRLTADQALRDIPWELLNGWLIKYSWCSRLRRPWTVYYAV